MKNSEFDAVVELARRSATWRLGRWAIDSWRGAWAASSLVRAAVRFWSSIAAWPTEIRVRCAALTIAWAGIGYAIGLALLPRYAISGLPRPWIGTVVVAALIVAALPQAFAAAWRERVHPIQKSIP